MAYTSVASVKRILQISEGDTSLDAEIADVLPSGDALVDCLLKQKGLTVPSPVPQNVADAAAFFIAWMVRRPRDPVGAEAFWVEANRFLDAYAEAEAEPYVGSA
jgi:hypothetical protein